MEIVIGGIFLGGLGAVAWCFLTLRERGRAWVWGRLAARCYANFEAAIVREERDRQFMSDYLGRVE